MESTEEIKTRLKSKVSSFNEECEEIKNLVTLLRSSDSENDIVKYSELIIAIEHHKKLRNALEFNIARDCLILIERNEI